MRTPNACSPREGDPRNALYARINHLRGRLPTLPIADVSQQLDAYLDDPIVESDARLRLRVLVIKGETDQDLDPTLAEKSRTEALAVAESLKDAGWVNRALGELGLVAFLQGNINASVVALGQALKVAQATGDTASVVRWTTLFGHGYVQLGRPAEAVDFCDRALHIAATVPELQFPLMTFVGKGDALLGMGRVAEAEQVIQEAMEAAERHGSPAYLAQLHLQLAAVAHTRKDHRATLEAVTRAAVLATKAGAGRLVAEVALQRAALQRAMGDNRGRVHRSILKLHLPLEPEGRLAATPAPPVESHRRRVEWQCGSLDAIDEAEMAQADKRSQATWVLIDGHVWAVAPTPHQT